MRATDDNCPIPSNTVAKIVVCVQGLKNLPPPQNLTVVPDSLTGHTFIQWKPLPNDTNHLFIRYILYYSEWPTGPFQPIDSFSNIKDSSYIHTGVNVWIKPAYYLIKTISYACNDTLTSLASNIAMAELAGISENSGIINNLLLYPNPTQNTVSLRVSLKSNSRVNYEIMGIKGEKAIVSETLFFPQGVSEVTIPLNILTARIYYFKISTSKDVIVKKLVINR